MIDLYQAQRPKVTRAPRKKPVSTAQAKAELAAFARKVEQEYAAKQVTSEQATETKSAAKKTTRTKATVNKPATKKAIGTKAIVKKPAAKKPAAKKAEATETQSAPVKRGRRRTVEAQGNQ